MEFEIKVGTKIVEGINDDDGSKTGPFYLPNIVANGWAKSRQDANLLMKLMYPEGEILEVVDEVEAGRIEIKDINTNDN